MDRIILRLHGGSYISRWRASQIPPLLLRHLKRLEQRLEVALAEGLAAAPADDLKEQYPGQTPGLVTGAASRRERTGHTAKPA